MEDPDFMRLQDLSDAELEHGVERGRQLGKQLREGWGARTRNQASPPADDPGFFEYLLKRFEEMSNELKPASAKAIGAFALIYSFEMDRIDMLLHLEGWLILGLAVRVAA